MIHDKIENLSKYLPGNQKEYIEEFMSCISTDMPEGFYEINGENIFAKVMSYPTKPEAECTVEAHNVYCDIQFSIIGGEGISVYPRESLLSADVNEFEDFYTFDGRDELMQGKVYNRVGYFTMIHTNEAHRPQESIGGKCGTVKKGVIKIKERLFDE